MYRGHRTEWDEFYVREDYWREESVSAPEPGWWLVPAGMTFVLVGCVVLGVILHLLGAPL